MSDGKVVTPPLAKPQWEAATLASDEVNAIIIISLPTLVLKVNPSVTQLLPDDSEVV